MNIKICDVCGGRVSTSNVYIMSSGELVIYAEEGKKRYKIGIRVDEAAKFETSKIDICLSCVVRLLQGVKNG